MRHLRQLLAVLVVGWCGGQQELDSLRQTVPGEPGLDYPILANIPETSFQCQGKVFGGFYADPDTRCQVYHVCVQDSEQTLLPISFLCPNGTVFNQELFTCEWWFNADCTQATTFYQKNDGLFSGGGEGGEGGSCPSVSPLSPGECEGAVSTCWSPGQPDGDCPDFGLCCFDGCVNTCPQVSERAKPVPRSSTEGYSYVTPGVTLPVRPVTSPQTTTEIQLLYGAPRAGRARDNVNRRRGK